MTSLERHQPGQKNGRLRIVSRDMDLVSTLTTWAERQEHTFFVSDAWVACDSAAASPTVSVGDWDASLRSPAAYLSGQADHALLLLPRSGPTSSVPVDSRLDLLARPFSDWELLWRVERAVASTRDSRFEVALKCGPLAYDRKSQTTYLEGVRLELRRSEQLLLAYLMEHAGRPVTTRELQAHVLGTAGDGGAARNQIYQLRKSLCAAQLDDPILTFGKSGYQLRWGAEDLGPHSSAASRGGTPLSGELFSESGMSLDF